MLTRAGVEQRRFGRHRDRFGGAADFELQVDLQLLAQRERQAGADGLLLKPGAFDGDAVGPRQQQRRFVVAAGSWSSAEN